MFISLHPYLNRVNPVFTWMAGSSPAMTKNRKTGAAKRSTTANAIRATKHTLRGVASVEELEAWEELRDQEVLWPPRTLIRGRPGYHLFIALASAGILCAFSPARPSSDSSLSRRGVDGRDTPGSQPGGGQDGGAPEAHPSGRLRDASAAQIRQHRRRRRQYRCIMSHSEAARRCRNAERRGRASFGELRPISPTEAGIVTYRHSIGD
jgi:hypothetical protein